MNEERRASGPAPAGADAAGPASPALPAGQAAPRKPAGLAHLLLHLHPRMVAADALALPRTFGLGGAALLLFVLLAMTGALLLFVYEPSTARSYASVVALQEDVPFGSFVRALHHWAGNLLLVVAVLHLVRVVFTGAFLPPRRLNWLLGLGMLALVMAANFTGYLLPWDQLAYWAVTIGTGMLQYVPVAGDALVRLARGGPEVGPRTLSAFFVLHIALLPILLFLCASFHFWLVRKAGGVMVPRASGAAGVRPATVPVQPELVYREGVASLVVLALVSVIAALASAPLGEQANPGLSPNPAKAPWYFMGIQELLVHVHPAVAVLVVPAACLAFLAAVPFLRHDTAPSGRWFHSARGRQAVASAAIAALVLVPAAVLLDEKVLRTAHFFARVPAAVATGLGPLVAWSAIAAALAVLQRRALALTRFEIVQSLFAFAATALLVLTVLGIVFRGPGMRLAWPG